MIPRRLTRRQYLEAIHGPDGENAPKPTRLDRAYFARKRNRRRKKGYQ